MSRKASLWLARGSCSTSACARGWACVSRLIRVALNILLVDLDACAVVAMRVVIALGESGGPQCHIRALYKVSVVQS